MERRTFIALLGGIAASRPLVVRAQKRPYRLGISIPSDREMPAVVAFFDELRLAGFIEGENLTVIPGGFGVRNEQIAELTQAIIKAGPDAVVCGPELQIRALQATTRTIPLIAMAEDLVGLGLANSLAHPGGNTTGVSLLSPEVDEKRQDILIDAVPRARRMAMLVDSNTARPRHLEAMQTAGRRRGVELSSFGVSKPEEIAPAISAAKASGAEAINFLATPLFSVPGARASRSAADSNPDLSYAAFLDASWTSWLSLAAIFGQHRIFSTSIALGIWRSRSGAYCRWSFYQAARRDGVAWPPPARSNC